MSDSVGSVYVEVRPDARLWSERLRAQIRDQTVTVNADADTGEAEAKLDEVARPRSATINAKVDRNAVSQLDSFVGKLGLLPALAIAAGAALVPLGGVLAGIAAGLAAPLAIAGGGATLFAFLGGLAIKDTQQKLKDIDTLSNKLEGLTKGTQEYRDVQSQLKVAQDNLSPSQERFATSLGNLKGTFETMLSGKVGSALLGPFSQGMDLLSRVLPIVAPLIESVSGAFSSLLGDLGRGAGSKGFSDFVGQMARLAGPDIESLGHILGNVAVGVGKLFGALGKGHFSAGLLSGLDHITKSFSDWAGSRDARQGIRDLFDYFHKVGPQVGDTIGAVARALGKVVEALAPLGPVVLSGLTHAANALSDIPVPVLTALAAATAGLIGFQKIGGLKATGFAINKLTGGQGVLGGLIGAAKPVPVFVTNPGFGGGPGGVPGKFGKLPPAIGAGELVGYAGAVGLLIYAAYEGQKLARQNTHAAINSAIQTRVAPTLGSDEKRMNRPADGRNLTQLQSGGVPIDVAMKRLTIAAAPATNAFDTLRARAARASQAIDQIGPHAAASSAVAIHSVGALQAKLNTLHDKRFQIIAQDQTAISSLERLQAMTIRDKSFNVIQNNIERNVGPGGGMQHHALGGYISGRGSGTSDSIPSWLSNGEYVMNAQATAHNRALLDALNSGRSMSASAYGAGGAGGGVIHTHVHLNDKEIGQAITPLVEDRADRVYHANRAYEETRRSR